MILKRRYDNTYDDFTYNDSTYNIKNVTLHIWFLFTVISKVIYKVK